MTIRAVIFDLGGVLLELHRHHSGLDGADRQAQDLHRYEQMNTELVTFMASLRPHYKIATICNGGSREAMNRKFQFRERVDLMVFDEEEGVSKPDARIYQLTLVRLHVQPEEAVFVDDKVQNVEAAQRLGLHTVLFKATAQTIVDLRSLLFTLQ